MGAEAYGRHPKIVHKQISLLRGFLSPIYQNYPFTFHLAKYTSCIVYYLQQNHLLRINIEDLPKVDTRIIIKPRKQSTRTNHQQMIGNKKGA